MVKTPRELVSDGKALLGRLDLESPFLVTAAFWSKGIEESTYKLRLRIKELESVGPSLLYKQAQRLIKKRPALTELRLEDIVLIKDGDETLVALKQFSQGAAFRDCVVSGMIKSTLLLDGDLYVYRVN